MKFQAALILIGVLVVCISLNEVRKETVLANDMSSGIAQQANAQASTGLAPTKANSSTSVHFEPLLLLLLGSTLFSIGTAIKLALSRKLDPKRIGVRKPPSPQL
jgi:hypothetical protein